MRQVILPFLLALVLAAPAAALEPVATVLATSVRHDAAEGRLYLTVTGRTAAGGTVYREEPLDRERFGVEETESWVSSFARYDVRHCQIVYRDGDRRYLAGTLETYTFKDGRPASSRAALSIPWDFRPDTQSFEFDVDVRDLPQLDEWMTLRALGSRALHEGDPAAAAALAERGLGE